MQDSKTLDNVIKEIRDSKRSLVLSHQNPDGDALGSMLALGAILKKVGHVVDHVTPDSVPEIYQLLPFANLIKKPDDNSLQKNHDLAFCVDCGSVNRLGKAKPLWLNAKVTINIDHHISNETFGKINWIEAGATSTGQLIYWLTKKFGIKITKEIATLLYTTLLTDTNCFANSNTNTEALLWGAELISQGADHEMVYRKAFLERSFKSMKVLGRALSDLTIIEGSKLAVTSVDSDTMKSLGATSEDTEDIADYIMRTKGVEVGVFFREDKGETKVSLRSNTDFDVSKIAISLGGGGHKRAAGINMKLPFHEAKDLVLQKIIGELRNYNAPR